MGFFKDIVKITDPADTLGIRAGEAQDAADKKAREAMAMEQQWFDYMKEISGPSIAAGQQALPQYQGLVGALGPEAQQTEMDALTQSPFYQTQISEGERAVLGNQAMTGGFRSGTTQENLARNSQLALQDTYNQKLSGLGSLSGMGQQSGAQFQQGGTQSVGSMTGILGQQAQMGVDSQAAQQQNMMGIAGMIASMFSDERLKEDIVEIGTKDGFPWYSWQWSEEAEKFGLAGKDEGHIAQEIEKTRPDLITERFGYKTVNYGGM